MDYSSPSPIYLWWANAAKALLKNDYQTGQPAHPCTLSSLPRPLQQTPRPLSAVQCQYKGVIPRPPLQQLRAPASPRQLCPGGWVPKCPEMEGAPATSSPPPSSSSSHPAALPAPGSGWGRVWGLIALFVCLSVCLFRSSGRGFVWLFF